MIAWLAGNWQWIAGLVFALMVDLEKFIPSIANSPIAKGVNTVLETILGTSTPPAPPAAK